MRPAPSAEARGPARGAVPPCAGPRLSFDEAAAAAAEAAHGLLNACAVPAPKLATPALCLPTVRDGLDEFRRVYGARGGEALLVRPDGHLGLRVTPASSPELPAHLDMLFGR